MGRVLINRVARPDFIWSPYKDFVSGAQRIHGCGRRQPRASVPPESDQRSAAEFQRRQSALGSRASGDPDAIGQRDVFPGRGHAAGQPRRPTHIKNVNKSWELLDNVIWSRGRHLVTAGAGLLLRSSDGYLTIGARRPVSFQQHRLFRAGPRDWSAAAGVSLRADQPARRCRISSCRTSIAATATRNIFCSPRTLTRSRRGSPRTTACATNFMAARRIPAL